MAFKFGIDKEQNTFLPPVIDDYVGPNDPVRVYDAFIDALDFNDLGISLIPNAGAERYEPRKMLKLILRLSYGDRSSRKLVVLSAQPIIYLAHERSSAGLSDHHTFRGECKDAINAKQCRTTRMELTKSNTLFLDSGIRRMRLYGILDARILKN